MIVEYDEDDTHICLKCNLTIVGLDNYVAHRKSGCGKNVQSDPSKLRLRSQLLPSDEIDLKADDFFSSLELRSSSKKIEQATSGKSFTGILTRSRTTAVMQATSSSNKDQFTSEPKSESNVWIGGNQLKDLGIGDNESKLIKAVANLERKKDTPIPQIPRNFSSVSEIFDEQFDDYNYDENELSDEDYAPSRTGGKWKPDSLYQWQESSLCFSAKSFTPPSDYIRGKPLEDDNQLLGSKYNIIPGHGKGKGKSVKIESDFECISTNQTKGKWKMGIKSEEDNFNETHAKGGKWKPIDYFEDAMPGVFKDDEEDIPPPTHTKGKWKPGTDRTVATQSTCERMPSRPDINDTNMISSISFKKMKIITSPKMKRYKLVSKKPKRIIRSKRKNLEFKTVNKSENCNFTSKTENFKDETKLNVSTQYWCSTCNRRLSSKIVYDRHLKSDFHLKRIRQDGDFDDGNNILSKNIRSETVRPNDNSLLMMNSGSDSTQKSRRRKKIYERCLVCNSKVSKQIIGKHLISHYHCRKGDISTAVAKAMVLDNIDSIVVECPFQCHLCKFYCNTHEEFINHWKSNMHLLNDSLYRGYYFCLFCKHKSEQSDSMLLHLNSSEHLEVVSVINRSVPITIKKIKEIICLTCQKKFMLNIQLMKHCREMGHDLSNVGIFTGKLYKCHICIKVFANPVAMQRHKKIAHEDIYYFCNICDTKFTSSEEAKKHRLSSAHKYTALKRKDLDGNLERNCEYCGFKFANFHLLKDHLKQNHPEHQIRCPHCDSTFTVSQELAHHIRLKSCQFSSNPNESEGDSYQCKTCPYKSNVKSEFLYHVTLHNDPIHSATDTENLKSKHVKKYLCPLCDKLFSQYSLQAHIRVHLDERPYVCKICKASFARKNNWKYHESKHKRATNTPIKKDSSEPKLFLCYVCGANFGKKFTLQQHMLIHNGKLFKCSEMECCYEARKASELQEHLRVHSDEKNYCCEFCSYKGKSRKHLKKHQSVHEEVRKYQCSLCTHATKGAANLKRHMVVHTRTKPYFCPHCDYKCNILENLRKHILSTNKHPGKTIYCCNFCDETGQFETNFAKDFKTHLLSYHKEMFANSKDATDYTANFFYASPDSKSLVAANEKKHQSRTEHKTIGKIEFNLNRIKTNDPIVPQFTSCIEGILDHMIPKFSIPKDTINTIELVTDSWNITDVEPSRNLVSFNGSENELFDEHF